MSGRISQPVAGPLPCAADSVSGPVHYAAVIRPAFYRWHEGRFESARLLDVDRASLGSLGERITVIEAGDFVAVVATEPSLAALAADRLRVHWTSPDIRGNTSVESSDRVAGVLSRHYRWPSRLGWGESEAWVVADCTTHAARLWVGTATPEVLRQDLSMLLSLAPDAIELFSDRSGTGLGRLASDDAAADAAFVSQRIGLPIAIRLDPNYQRDVDALGMAQRWVVRGWGEGAAPERLALKTASPGAAPVVALMLTRPECREPAGNSSAERASPYVGAHPEADDAPDGDDTPRLFAEESFLDEWADERQRDPLELRLELMEDTRGKRLIEAVRERAQWRSPVRHRDRARIPVEGLLHGRGFAYCHVPNVQDSLEAGTRAAWIADVAVDPVTGEVALSRVVVGQDAGAAPDEIALGKALEHALLKPSFPLVTQSGDFDQWGRDAASAGDPPAIDAMIAPLGTPPTTSPRLPAARIEGGTPSWRLSAATLAPGTAAIANALFDATGQRFRQPPFTPARVRAALQGEAADTRPDPGLPARRPWRRKGWLGAAASLVAMGSVAAGMMPWQPAMAPIPHPAAGLYSQAAIERGRLVAEAGDCAVCHTAGPDGETNAGGRAFDTPFGTLYSTNITPDESTGIGNWSYAAFERAMRHGVSRDGRHLYPAFPYTAFAKLSDADMQSLYAYLMTQPPTAAPAVENDLRFPFNIRGLMAGWNALYHDPKPFIPDPTRSALWNRGAYLAEGAGHCSACHSPRNAMGAEKNGDDYLGGALVDGWEAPALNALSKAPVAWTETALYDYLRGGRAEHHGVAAGPMAPVVAGLAELPESDVRAIAHYVASLLPITDTAEAARMAEATLAKSAATVDGFESGERLYNGACASCHDADTVAVFSRAETSLALNTNLHSERPDNVIQAILDGVVAPRAGGENAGEMPAFREQFSDSQLSDLMGYLRARFAPGEPAWQNLEARIGALRATAAGP
ncbi:cytochrome c [Salinicola peritrichatus]|uniref:cytochrome c n=1 Tax=Salinicola peritrichatus TaxID=1267424 RepID=UPI0013A67FF7|nr:c-type cytochrome [Salinicola peritrichatus]